MSQPHKKCIASREHDAGEKLEIIANKQRAIDVDEAYQSRELCEIEGQVSKFYESS